MLYENYQRKITKIAEILKVLRRFRVLILLLVSTAFASTGGFVATQGYVYDKVDCPVSLTYGEAFTYEAGALFEDVRYEFSTDAAFTNPTLSVPRMPGEYYVRAVSTSSFGNPRYGTVHAFSIQPKAIDVSVNEEIILYGETPTVSANLVYNDRITCSDYLYENITSPSTSVTPVEESITILDAEGNDVTEAYALNPVPTPLQFTAREITVTVANASHIYDSLPFSFHDYALTGGTLAGKDAESMDRLIATFDLSLTDAGSIDNIPTSIRVITSNGLDVSANYKIQIVSGKLTVEKRPIVINLKSETPTVEFVYDGKPHSFIDYSVSSDTPLVDGHKEVLQTYPTLTDVGTVPNLLGFTILDGDGKDVVKDNYSIFVPSNVFLSVTSRPLSVQTPSGEWTYDGQSHSSEEFSITSGTLVEGHTHSFSQALSITNAGTLENSTTLTITDATGKDVTSNYGVTNSFGTLTVHKLAISVQTADGSWIYDGEAHYSGTWTVTSETQPLEGQSLKLESHPSVSTVTVEAVSNVLVLSVRTADDTNVTDNYDITYTYGSLQITPRKLSVKTENGEWVYDGAAHSVEEWSIVSEQKLVEGHIAKIVSNPSVTNVSEGEVTNAIVLSIHDAEDVDLTSNYELEYSYGTLKITPRVVTIHTGSAEKVYDGTPLTQLEGFLVENLVEGHDLHVSMIGTITNVGSVPNAVAEDAITVDRDGEPIDLQNYTFVFDYGALTITKRPITIYTANAEKIYDGTPLTKTDEWWVENLASGQLMTLTVTGTQTNAGESSNTVDEASIKILKGSEEISLDNYEISYSLGTLTVHKRAITIETESQTFTYDGTAHVWEEYALINDTSLAAGQRLVITANTSITNVSQGLVENNLQFIVLDSEDNNVTDNYEMEFVLGQLQVLPRAITVTTPNAEKVYDGTPLTKTDEWTVENLAEGQSMTLTVTGSQTVKGFSENLIDLESIRIWSGETEIELSNYEISYQYGTLTVLARPVTVQSQNQEWIYDGQTHTWEETLISVGTLVPGHTVQVVESTSVLNVTAEPVVNRLIVIILDENGEEVTVNYEISYDYGTLNVTKRVIRILTGSEIWVYDGMPHSLGEFSCISDLKILDGHNVMVHGLPSVTNVLDGTVENIFTITIHTNEDVTSNYEISYEYGTLVVTPRPIHIQTNSFTITYDGEAHWDTGFLYLSNEQIVFGQTYIAHGYPSITNVWESPVDNIFSITIVETVNGEVIDRSSNYSITYDYGTLEIVKRTIVLQTASHIWTYDGEAHSDPTWSYHTDSVLRLVGGHSIDVLSFVSITNVLDGPLDNVLTVRVLNEEQADITQNYDVDIRYGSLRIDPRKITLYTDSQDWVYDGESHSSPVYGYKDGSGTVIGGHSLVVTNFPSVTNVWDGKVINLPEVTIVDALGVCMDSNYEVALECGTLEILKRPVSVQTMTSSWIYDAQPHFDTNWWYYNSSYPFVDGQLVKAVDYPVVTNVWDGEVSNAFTLQVWNAEETENLSANYEITYLYGTLRINKRSINIQTNNKDWDYDGEAHSETGWTYQWWSSYSILDGHTAVSVGFPSVTNVSEGMIQNQFSLQILRDSDNLDVTENYQIDYSYGYIWINKRQVSVSTGSMNWTYDGEAHSYTEWTYQDGITKYELVDGHTAVAVGYPTIQNIWENDVWNYYSLKILDKNNEDVSENYYLNYEYGWLHIDQRKISIITNTQSWIYDGETHFDTGFLYEEGSYELVKDHTYVAIGYPTVTTVWDKELTNIFWLEIYDKDGQVVTANYDIGYSYGTIKIDKRYISIQTANNDWIYDAQPHSDTRFIYLSTLQIVKNQTYSVSCTPTVTNVWDYVKENNRFEITIYSVNGVDVTDNYQIDYSYGSIRINKRPVAIQTNSNEWYYDGQAHCDPGWTYHSESIYDLVPGQQAVAEGYPYVSTVGEGAVENRFSLRIWSEDGSLDVSENYKLDYAYGTIKIKQRPIIIETNTAAWVYDAMSHYDSGWFYRDDSPFAIVEGQTSLSVGYPIVSTVGDGVVSNVFDLLILDEEENDVTANYDITYYYGTVQILKRAMTIITNSQDWIYDGKPHYDAGWIYHPQTPYEVVEGQTVQVDSYVEITNVWDNAPENNRLVLSVRDELGEDVTANYELNMIYGTIRILPRPVTVVTNSHSWVYDGMAHSDAGWEYSTDTRFHFLTQHKVIVIQPVPTVTNVWEGEVSNQLNLGVILVKNNSMLEEMTQNYSITYQCGTLTVTPKTVEVTLSNQSKRYDRVPLEANESIVLPDGFLLPGHRSELRAVGSINYIGSIQKTVAGDIYDSNGVPVTQNYRVIILEGYLEVQPAAVIKVTTQGASKIYDGMPLTNSGISYEILEGALLPGHNVTTLTTMGSQTRIGSSGNGYQIIVTDAGGNNVNEFYSFESDLGTLTVLPVLNLEIASGSAEKRYDGTPLMDSSLLMNLTLQSGLDGMITTTHISSSLVEDGAQTYVLVKYQIVLALKGESEKTLYLLVRVTGSQTEIGKSENLFDVTLTDEAGNDVTAQYEIEKSFGELSVLHIAKILVESGSAEKPYDGTPLTNESYSVEILEDNLLPGHRLQVVFTGFQTDLGSSDNTFECYVFDELGNDVTHLYQFQSAYGTLTVTVVATISIETLDATKTFDGMPLVNQNYTLSFKDGELLPGHFIQSVTVTGTQTDVGTSFNTVVIVILDQNDRDVTRYYQIETNLGVLTVRHPSKLHITTPEANKAYDGTPLTAPADVLVGLVEGVVLPEGFEAILTAADSEMVDGKLVFKYELTLTNHEAYVITHFISVYANGSQTEMGSSDNDYVIRIEDAQGLDVTGLFDLTHTLGKLTVQTVATIEITTGNAEKLYDGDPLTSAEIVAEIASGSVFENYTVLLTLIGNETVEDVTYVKYSILLTMPNGRTVTHYLWLTTTGSQTEIGVSDNTFRYRLADSEGEELGPYYEIKGILGSLIVFDEDAPEEEGFNGSGGGGGSLDPSGSLKDDGELGLPELNGTLNGSGEPAVVLRVLSEQSGFFYVRLMSYGDYNGGGFEAATSYPKALMDRYSYNYLTGIALEQNGYEAIKAIIDSSTSDYLLPYFLSTKESFYEIQDSDVKYVGDTSEKYTLYYYLYTGSGNDLKPIQGELRDEEAAYATYVKNTYLAIDDETKALMEAIIAEKGFSLNDKDIIQKVASYIQSVATYSLEYDRNLDKEDNVVVAFLSEYQEGICQHYAASATMLYRALGIPARYTIGYAGSTKAGEWSVITSLDGHAWTEVYIDGIGWIPVEVTGGMEGGMGGSGGESGGGTGGESGGGTGGESGGGTGGGSGGGTGGESGGGSGGSGDRYGGNLDINGMISGGTPSEGEGKAVVLRVMSEKTGDFYVRLLSYGDYHGRGFQTATSFPKALVDRYSYTYLSGLALEQNGYRPAQATIESFTSDYLLPYFLSMADGSYDVQSSDTWNAGDSSAAYSFYYYPYAMDSYGTGLSALRGEYSAAEAEYAAYVKSNYLTMDAETRAFMEQIIAREGFNLSDGKVVQRVAEYIQSAATYNLKYDRSLDEESNIVIAFLTDYKEGICQHYAASATMLYRALGIPARYTVGYAGSTRAGEWTEITLAQAHAWTEIYIDGIGWIPVEVTGGGPGGGSGGGSVGGGPTVTVEIKPVDVNKGYDGTPLLPENRLEVGYLSKLAELLDKGYTYSVTVEGSQTERGSSESIITSFTLYDPLGNDVTDEFNIVYKPGEIKVTNPQIEVVVYQVQKIYDGNPLSYEADDYWIKEGLPAGYRLEFSLEGISMTEVGELDLEELEALPYKVYDAYGNDVTDQFYLKISGAGMRIAPRTITVTSASQTKEYDGSALTSPTLTVSVGSLAVGHRIVGTASGSITDVGTVKNKINVKTIKILDAQGNDVTDFYKIETIEGTLTVLDR